MASRPNNNSSRREGPTYESDVYPTEDEYDARVESLLSAIEDAKKYPNTLSNIETKLDEIDEALKRAYGYVIWIIKDRQNTILKLTERIDSLARAERQLKELNKEYEKEESEKRKLQRDAAEYIEKIENLNVKEIELQNKITELERKGRDDTQSFRDLEARLQRVVADNEAFQARLQQTNDQLSRNHTETLDLSRQRAELAGRIFQFENDKIVLESQVQTSYKVMKAAEDELKKFLEKKSNNAAENKKIAVVLDYIKQQSQIFLQAINTRSSQLVAQNNQSNNALVTSNNRGAIDEPLNYRRQFSQNPNEPGQDDATFDQRRTNIWGNNNSTYEQGQSTNILGNEATTFEQQLINTPGALSSSQEGLPYHRKDVSRYGEESARSEYGTSTFEQGNMTSKGHLGKRGSLEAGREDEGHEHYKISALEGPSELRPIEQNESIEGTPEMNQSETVADYLFRVKNSINTKESFDKNFPKIFEAVFLGEDVFTEERFINTLKGLFFKKKTISQEDDIQIKRNILHTKGRYKLPYYASIYINFQNITEGKPIIYEVLQYYLNKFKDKDQFIRELGGGLLTWQQIYNKVAFGKVFDGVPEELSQRFANEYIRSKYPNPTYFDFVQDAYTRYFNNFDQIEASPIGVQLLRRLFPEIKYGGKSIKMRMSSKTKRAHKAKQWKTANHLVRVRNSRRKRKHNLTKKTS